MFLSISAASSLPIPRHRPHFTAAKWNISKCSYNISLFSVVGGDGTPFIISFAGLARYLKIIIGYYCYATPMMMMSAVYVTGRGPFKSLRTFAIGLTKFAAVFRLHI